MDLAWTYFAEQVELNAEFESKLQARLASANVPWGATILIAANTVTIPDGYIFTVVDRSLVLLADELNCGTGQLKISVPDTQSGRSITAACGKVLSVSLWALGGAGTPGTGGGNGRPGSHGKNGNPSHPDGFDGGQGGRGGNGRPGGAGGPGGQISFFYVDDHLLPGGFDPGAALFVAGGPGGDGGAGGQGGEGGPGGEPYRGQGAPGMDGPPGEDGDPGPRGDGGPDGSWTANKVSNDELLKIMATLAPGWSDYRRGLGEYYFRAFNPVDNLCFDRALANLQAAIALNPADELAAAYLQQLVDNENIFGMGREYDLIPDFERYERTVTDYLPIITDLFQQALFYLRTTTVTEAQREQLVERISDLHLRVEDKWYAWQQAVQGWENSTREMEGAQTKLEALKARAEALQNQMWQHETDVFGELEKYAKIVEVVVDLGVAIFGNQAHIVKAVPELIDAFSILTYADSKDVTTPGYKEYLEEGATDIRVLWSTGKALISFPKTITALARLPENNPEEAELKKVQLDLVMAVHDLGIATIQSSQAKHQMWQAEFEFGLTKATLAEADKHEQELVATEERLLAMARSLLAAARGSGDVLLQMNFYAIRALEIYSLQDLSEYLHYDYGYVKPEREAILQLKADDKEIREELVSLVNEYQTSWYRFVNIVQLREQYEDYYNSGDWARATVYKSFTQPWILDAFRREGFLVFVIDLADLLTAVTEAHVEAVAITMAGMSADTPTVPLILTHSGQTESRKRDGSVKRMSLRPRRTIIEVSNGVTDPAFTGTRAATRPGDDLAFWGRGVATRWQLELTEDAATKYGVDLSNLAEITVHINYRGLLL